MTSYETTADRRLQDRISSNKHVLLAGRQNSHTRYEKQNLFQLRSLSDNSIQLMEGKIRKNAILSCEMFIPNNLVLEDGDYILWLKFDEEGSVYPLSYHLTFRDKMVSMVRDTKYILRDAEWRRYRRESLSDYFHQRFRLSRVSISHVRQ